ncbi:HlyD family secretion protein [Lebetimonas sp. JH369]|uniref:HlyD family secretion protein n=2 Tax=unclassified Lebetimonas TaxID=2648158 RepID=UPI0004651D95|nr:HlyD family efflux transporter periplasmic adaptor subunit [Lebetimonas sp. JH369]
MKKNIVGIILIILVAIGGVLIYKALNAKKMPPGLVAGVGNFDGDLININTKYPGRIVKINIDDGSDIKKGSVIAVLDSDEYKDKLKAIEAEIKAKKNELNFTAAKIKNGIKQAELAYGVKKDELNSLKKNIEILTAVIAQDKNFNKSSKENLDTAIASKENIKALKNAILALKAKRDEIQSVINELTIKSPINGHIVDKVANIGEVLGAGMSVATAINPQKLYLKMYVDEINNGKIKIGERAVIFLDAYPNKPIKARVIKIAQRAEFTPKEVEVREDRIQRVYEVDIKPVNPNPLIKFGLPGIGVISIGGRLPKNLDELPKL